MQSSHSARVQGQNCVWELGGAQAHSLWWQGPRGVTYVQKLYSTRTFRVALAMLVGTHPSHLVPSPARLASAPGGEDAACGGTQDPQETSLAHFPRTAHQLPCHRGGPLSGRLPQDRAPLEADPKEAQECWPLADSSGRRAAEEWASKGSLLPPAGAAAQVLDAEAQARSAGHHCDALACPQQKFLYPTYPGSVPPALLPPNLS